MSAGDAEMARLRVWAGEETPRRAKTCWVAKQKPEWSLNAP